MIMDPLTQQVSTVSNGGGSNSESDDASQDPGLVLRHILTHSKLRHTTSPYFLSLLPPVISLYWH